MSPRLRSGMPAVRRRTRLSRRSSSWSLLAEPAVCGLARLGEERVELGVGEVLVGGQGREQDDEQPALGLAVDAWCVLTGQGSPDQLFRSLRVDALGEPL